MFDNEIGCEVSPPPTPSLPCLINLRNLRGMKLRGLDGSLLPKYEKNRTEKSYAPRLHNTYARVKGKWKSVKEEEKTLCSAPTKAS